MKILCCDDNIDALYLLEKELNDHLQHAIVINSMSADDAIEQLNILNFDAIVCDFDLNSPNQDGLTVFEYSQSTANNEVPFILYTSHSHEIFCHIDNQRFHYVDKLNCDFNKMADIIKSSFK